MSPAGPAVWFERAVPAELADEVALRVTVLGPGTPEDPYAGLADADGLLASVLRYDAALLDRAPHVRVIARTGIGYDLVDVAEATRRGIAVCNTPDGPTVSTAEHAVGLMLAVAKGLKRSEAELRNGATGSYARHRAVELDGKRLGLVGFGRIARRVARFALALGMQVEIFDPFLAADAVPSEVSRAATLEALLASSDVVSLHLPLSEASHGLIGRRELELLRPGAILVNTARGGLVDTAALLAALEAGRLHGVGLDVTDPEPLPPDHPLLRRDDVVVTAHVASATPESRTRIFRMALDQAMAVLEGRRPEHLVNPEVWASPGSGHDPEAT